ncbi:hypothetical protein ScPMuIL_000587 [Solemya velum]
MSKTMDKTLPPTRTSRPQLENIRKVAVTKLGEQAQFLELDQHRPLMAIIQDICDTWKLQSPSDFALQFSEPNRKTYITERTRNDIQNGNVLELTLSPAKTAQNILDVLKGPKTERLEALKKLSILAGDSTFSMEFINRNGHDLIIEFVTSGQLNGDPLADTLKSFVSLMEHNVVQWDILRLDFIDKVSDCVVSSTAGNTCKQLALEILESVVLHSSESLHSKLEKTVTPEKIIPLLKSPQSGVQENAIALINAMISKAQADKKIKMFESLKAKSMRQEIINNILSGSKKIGTKMGYQLYVFQTLMMNMHEVRMNTPADPHDVTVLKSIDELRHIAFEMGTDQGSPAVKKATIARDNKKLGFENQTNPIQDFVVKTPPGLLALDNILYFAQNHGEIYVKVVLENSSRADEHDCPFIKAGITLTKILCDILKVGEMPQEECHNYYPMFFCHDKPFAEFFCVSIQILNKTWREMRASTEDFQKVLSVVKEQITRALVNKPTSFDAFRTKLNQLTYAEIIKIWEEERKIKEEWESQAKPIVDLRKKITPEIKELIRQHRLGYLVKGSRFPKYHNRGRMKDKFQYWRLAPNFKALHYGDCTEAEVPTLEQLSNKLLVVDIKSVVLGKTPVKEKTRRPNVDPHVAFAIMPDGPETEDNCHFFVASSSLEFGMWIDGLHALLQEEMGSPQAEEDLERLLSMEIKLRLLDTEGITIPTEPPHIPREPDNYNFAYPNI